MHHSLNLDITEREYFSAWNSFKCMKCEYYSNKNKNFKCKECKYFKGVVWVKREEDRDLRRMANYQAKYFAKGFEEELLNQRNFSQNRYLCSHDLKMPKIDKEYLTEEQILKISVESKYIKNFGDGNSFNEVNDEILKEILK
jgi:hypothetical protein